MPELPEVETVKECLKHELLGCSITKIDFHRRNLRWDLPKKYLRETLVGNKIIKVLEERSIFYFKQKWDTLFFILE